MTRWKDVLEYCEKATDGPWTSDTPLMKCLKHEVPHPGPPECEYTLLEWVAGEHEVNAMDLDTGSVGRPTVICGTWNYEEGGVVRQDDAEFIARARTDLPKAARIAAAVEEWLEYVQLHGGHATRVALEAISRGEGPTK